MAMLKGLCVCVPIYSLAMLLLGASITVSIFVFHIVITPLIFKYSKAFRRHLIFVNFVHWPPNIDYENPSARGIEGVRNFYIEHCSTVDKCPIKIGIWHILPKSVYERLKGSFEAVVKVEELNRLLDDELANSKTPIILYCHGNSNSRAATHRIQLYKFLQQMDFHTIAFDYRGYGDSTNVRPSEMGVVEDSLVMYEWLHDKIVKGGRKPPVFVWGHSLGTGISSHLLGNLDELSSYLLKRSTPLPRTNGLILESPFNNLAEEVAIFPLTKLVRWLPYFERMFVAPFRTAPEQRFHSDAHLSRARSLPVLMLHARDDDIVPFVVGEKLYKTILESRSEGDATVKLHAYDKSERLGHRWICNAKDLADVVGGFVENHR